MLDQESSRSRSSSSSSSRESRGAGSAAAAVKMAEDAAPPARRHLVVMSHGLWGQAKNLDFLRGLIHTRVDEQELPVVVVNSDVNELYLTYQGSDACGERLVQLIVDKCTQAAEEGKPFTHISLIGYSMGGLIVRYAAGRLYTLGALRVTPQAHERQRKLLGRSLPPSGPPPPAAAAAAAAPFPGATKATTAAARPGEAGAVAVTVAALPAGFRPLEPVNFVTIATPHLGTWSQPTSWYGRTFNRVVPQVAARSGAQFMLLDHHAWGRPILVNMSDPELPFMQALACFPHLTLLANTLHDRTVPYKTAIIAETNPYEACDAEPVDPKYPSIVRPVPRPAPSSRTFCRRNSKAAAAPAEEEDSESGGDATGAGGGGTRAAGGPEQQQQKQRARKGWAVRVVFLALFPLTIPLAVCLLSYMVYVGRKQWAEVLHMSFDHTWVEEAGRHLGTTPRPHATKEAPHNGHAASLPAGDPAPPQDGPADALPEASPQDVTLGLKAAGAAATASRTSVDGDSGGATPIGASPEELPLLCARVVGAETAGGLVAGGRGHPSRAGGGSVDWGEGEQQGGERTSSLQLASKHGVLAALAGSALALPPPSLHSTTVVQQSDDAPASAGGGGGAPAAAAKRRSGTGAAARRGPSIEVTIDSTKELHVDDGLVTHGDEREAQEWMMRNLNLLPWNKVDVDTRHYHAHAAIILRTPKRFMDNRDSMQWLADHLVLSV